uniref:RING-type domain-containing protein n=1 Tax=Pygocentrus nattereri TaxID=42514 RepID=A0A3B4D159_PYGNA
MASSSSLLSEDQLLCSICLDVFTDPVSTPCGHILCRVCLKEGWDSSSCCQCPVCKEEFSRRPDLHLNTFISGLGVFENFECGLCFNLQGLSTLQKTEK